MEHSTLLIFPGLSPQENHVSINIHLRRSLLFGKSRVERISAIVYTHLRTVIETCGKECVDNVGKGITLRARRRWKNNIKMDLRESKVTTIGDECNYFKFMSIDGLWF